MAKRDTSWFTKAADLMVRESKTLAQVASELGLPITSAEAANLSRRKEFQQALWIAQNKFHEELASTPGRGKKQAQGLAVFLIQRLIEEGKWEKAMNALIQLAKLEGWLEPENQVNVFADLSQKDFDALKAKLKGINDKPERPSVPGTGEIFDA